MLWGFGRGLVAITCVWCDIIPAPWAQVNSSQHLWRLTLLQPYIAGPDVSVEQLVEAQEEWPVLLSLVGVILYLWKQGNAAPSLPRGCSTVQARGTTHTVSITDGSPRQWSVPDSWCRIAVLPISSCLVYILLDAGPDLFLRTLFMAVSLCLL